jgi:3-oxoacyl-[acyl-carrier protein] reductase
MSADELFAYGLGLAGNSVLVTGASGGIGAAIAVGFAALGSRVCIHYNQDRDGAQEVQRSSTPRRATQ